MRLRAGCCFWHALGVLIVRGLDLHLRGFTESEPSFVSNEKPHVGHELEQCRDPKADPKVIKLNKRPVLQRGQRAVNV